MPSPSPKTLRTRLRLMNKFEQLVERLKRGDPAAVKDAQDHLYGVALCADPDVLAITFQALIGVLNSFQGKIDSAGWKYSLAEKRD